MTYRTNPLLIASTGAASDLSLLTRVIDLVLDWSERARSRHGLAGLTASELRDIGLSPGDVDTEASKPFWRS